MPKKRGLNMTNRNGESGLDLVFKTNISNGYFGPITYTDPEVDRISQSSSATDPEADLEFLRVAESRKGESLVTKSQPPKLPRRRGNVTDASEGDESTSMTMGDDEREPTNNCCMRCFRRILLCLYKNSNNISPSANSTMMGVRGRNVLVNRDRSAYVDSSDFDY